VTQPCRRLPRVAQKKKKQRKKEERQGRKRKDTSAKPFYVVTGDTKSGPEPHHERVPKTDFLRPQGGFVSSY